MRFSLKTLVKAFLALVFLFWIIYFSDHHHDEDDDNDDDNPARVIRFNHQARLPYHHDDSDHDDDDDPTRDVYPDPRSLSSDRILAQIEFIPRSVKAAQPARNKVLLYIGACEHPEGTEYFQSHPCKVKSCELTRQLSRRKEADVVLFRDGQYFDDFVRPPGQIWVLYALESPVNTPSFDVFAGKINWTASYRRDSTLVTPYEKYVPFNRSELTQAPRWNYAEGKSKMVAWFVSNCRTPNRRLEYVRKLAKYVQVDIYGGCGPLKCSRHSRECSKLLNEQYKFYLAFENSNCRDYITEKFFVTGLQHDVVPVVMGATPQEYRRVAPPRSFIHVDDFSSPVALAKYLLFLDKHDVAYNSYFRWKGLWRNMDTLFPCRLCALAHDTDRPRERSWYPDVNGWWRGSKVCRNDESVRSWMMTKKRG